MISASSESAPAVRHRVWLALIIACTAGLFAAFMAARKDAVPDLLYPLTAARSFLAGQNPYFAMPGIHGAKPPFDEPFFYPFTTVLAISPLAPLSTSIAVGVFFSVSSFLLAYTITRDGLWRIHVFASAPFVVAASVGQFSPLLTVAALVPWAGALCSLKPNLGLAVLARRPSMSAVLSCAAFGLVSLAVSPHWMFDWLHNLRQEAGGARVHEIPLLQIGGFVLLASLVAIRRPNGRLLAVMSALPQALFFYDQLPLWLVAENRKQSIFLTACSQLGMLAWWISARPGESVVKSAYPFVLVSIYLPALVLVLQNMRRAPASSASARP